MALAEAALDFAVEILAPGGAFVAKVFQGGSEKELLTRLKRDFETVFADGIDAILTPATPTAAFGLEAMALASPIEMYLNDVFTVTVNMAGLPGIAVPAGRTADGLPLGLQLIGRPFDEEMLFRTAAVIEDAAGHFKPEPWWST